ncbi:hypothetical protein AU191_08880 [Mycolicibacterium acapulense]|nr:hypothetical protein AU191_08880 [Mycolicibacterium acapulense]
MNDAEKIIPMPRREPDGAHDVAGRAGECLANNEVESPPPEFGTLDGTELLDSLQTWFGRFVIAHEDDLSLLAVWTVHTYLCTELHTTPRLQLDSIAPECGKTTVLEHLERLCRDALLAVDLTSAALIPRMLQRKLRTLLLDEVQRTLNDRRPECAGVMAVINSGYRDGAKRPVLVPRGREWVEQEMSTFAPVCMAGISPHLANDTLSRSLRILLMPDHEGEAEDSDWEELGGVVDELAARVALWSDSVRSHVKEKSTGELPEGCRGRLREKWRPLMRVAELADGTGGSASRWTSKVYELAAADLANQQAEREAGLTPQTPGLVLLQDLAAIWPDHQYFVPTQDLIDLLLKHNPQYWGPNVDSGNFYKALNAHRLGRMIKQATNTTSRRPGGGGTPHGYEVAQLEPAWKRYGVVRAECPTD